MGIVRELSQLQEIELAIEVNEHTQSRIGHALTDNRSVLNAKSKLEAEQKNLEEQTRKQKAVDVEIEDYSAKIKNINRKLYDGKTTNSKELSNLQAEVEDFQKKRSQLEDRSLQLMEEIENLHQTIVSATQGLIIAEAEWEAQHKNLTTELTQLQTDHAAMDVKKQALILEIEPGALEIYKDIKKRKGTAVARVEQGICRGCRIAISNAELQQVKGGNIVKCNSCGRILYLP
jgi:predicted  nucleic acid-binding Zn-ribbon protein